MIILKPSPPSNPVMKRNVLLLSLSVNNCVVPSIPIGSINNIAVTISVML